jgi:hypothetical protein
MAYRQEDEAPGSTISADSVECDGSALDDFVAAS